MTAPTPDLFDLSGRVALITGGAGLLGARHAEAIAARGGVPVIVDSSAEAHPRAAEIQRRHATGAFAVTTDITDPASVAAMAETVLDRAGRVDILINNAARNPPPGSADDERFETLTVDRWNADLAVGLTGAFLCSQAVGPVMARQGKGVIVNVASDLSLISPDQRLYRIDGVPEMAQPVKSVTYPVVKTALLGLTRYLATYWAKSGVRVNALSPGGVQHEQSEEFVARLVRLVPMARMATVGEYEGAIVFLCSDASSYMTGANLVLDGGRTVW